MSDGGLANEPLAVGLQDILSAMLDCPKPIVGRIAGHCMGGGVGLAAACDISVAQSDARFGFTEVRVGVAPAIISVVCLPKLRRGDALELFLTGERVDASRAVEVGLITAAVPAGGLDESVNSMISKLVSGGPNALAAAKGLIYTIPGMDRTAAFAWATELSREVFSTDEATEGITAFREKRTASWVSEAP